MKTLTQKPWRRQARDTGEYRREVLQVCAHASRRNVAEFNFSDVYAAKTHYTVWPWVLKGGTAYASEIMPLDKPRYSLVCQKICRWWCRARGLAAAAGVPGRPRDEKNGPLRMSSRRFVITLRRAWIYFVMLAELMPGHLSAAALRVGCEANAPIVYTDGSGKPVGFAIDILQSIARERKLEIEILPADLLDQRLRAGTLDLVICTEMQRDLGSLVDHSISYASLPAKVLVRKGGALPKSVEWLADKRLAAPRGSPELEYALKTGLTKSVVQVADTKTALDSLDRGDCDAVIASVLVASRQIANHVYTHVEVSEIPLEGFRFKLYFGVPRGKPERLGLINESLAELYRTGAYAGLHERWLGPVEAKSFSWIVFLPYLLPVFSLLFLLFLALGWQRKLLVNSHKELRASEYFYHSLVETLPQIIARKDPQGRYTYANSAFGDLVARPLSEIIGRLDEEILPSSEAAKTRENDRRVMETRQTMEYERVIEAPDSRRHYFVVKRVPLFDPQGRGLGVQVLYWDMTAFRETEEQLRQTRKELIEASRRAGMAEIATNVLHNIGNCLNSVNVFAATSAEIMQSQKVANVTKVAALLEEQKDRLADFLTTDPRGRLLPEFLHKVAHDLNLAREHALNEIQSMRAGLEQINEIVAAQQEYVQAPTVRETVRPSELVEYAIQLCDSSLVKAGVAVTREFMPAPMVDVERQKCLRVLIDIISNAEEALAESPSSDKSLAIGIGVSAKGMVRFTMTDNGVGIPPENLTRIFALGFTTKKDGRGFGLHSAVLAATELGGSIQARSEGPGKGAQFIFELPPGRQPEAAPLSSAA